MAQAEARILLTPTFRLYYPVLLEPRAYHESGKPKGDPRFSTGMIFEKGDLAHFKEYNETAEEFLDVNFKDVLVDVAKNAWPDLEDITGAIKHGGIGWPIKKGDTVVKKKDGKHAEHLEGRFLINAGSSEAYAPALKARIDGKMVNLTRGLTADEAKIKSLFTGGNYAYAEINVKGTNVSDKKYLTLYLNAVCFVKPGERIGGGAGGLMDRYDGVSGGEADVDPTDGGDDEIPF